MNHDEIIRSLQPLTWPEVDGEAELPPTLADSIARMLSMGEKLGRSGFRATQTTEHIGNRLDDLERTLSVQLNARDAELTNERKRIGEFEEDIDRLVIAVIQISDLLGAAEGAARRELNEPAQRLFAKLGLELEKILRRIAIVPTAEVGAAPDPEFHEVVDESGVGSGSARTIVEVVRQGYRYKGKSVRIAKVVVGDA